MNEPRRLRELHGSPAEHALLNAGVSYRSSADAHAKTMAALGLAGSAALSAGIGGASVAPLFAKAGVGKLVAALSLIGAAAVPAGYLVWQQSRPAVVSVSVVSTAAAQAPALRAHPATLPAPPSLNSAPAPSETAAPEPTEAAKASTSHVGRAGKSDSAAALAAELGALDGVRAALSHGDATGALARLDSYGRDYPHGRLALEAEVLRIDALSRSGQATAASKHAESFLRRHPNSVLATRVRGYLRG
jgi:hypothetical protein